ncbi:MAG: phosphoadenosine phosphosulfate reductase family protein [Betaproteobacteria bacterium]|nr:phosphoadenosine phosphosulfate reductase family protein [Betaproteobacteria bacterium]
MNSEQLGIRPLHIVLISGGKDSAVCGALATRRLPRDRLRLVFADTGNEHPETYRYLDCLSSHLGHKIERLQADFSEEFAQARQAIARDLRTGRDYRGAKKRRTNRRKREALEVLRPTGNPFLDLCLLSGMFPTNQRRFCTRRLKTEVVANWLLAAHENRPLIVWQGVKRADSDKRADLLPYARQAPGWWIFRPLLEWTDADVFKYLDESGTPANPLYGSGFSRVSCAPCIYARKSEIRLLADRYPEQVERIRAWEGLVSRASKSGFAPFFSTKEIPATPAQRRHRFAIDGAVRWATVNFRKNKFARYEDVFGEDGRQGNLFRVCEAGQGLCE